MSRPSDWWPVCDTDPVPGDPVALAGLGRRMSDAAAEIEQMAVLLPRICTSEIWDSDAGEEFRVKAADTAAGVGKTHQRFFTVGQALGSTTGGGGGYAAALQQHQSRADAAINAVNGSSGMVGSEDERRNYWTLLLQATNGADPAQPPAGKGQHGPPAGPMPQASPGNIPPSLPVYPADDAEVVRLKNSYNAAIAELTTATTTITSAAAQNAADAQAAAQMIRNVIDHDGLQNPSGGLFGWFRQIVDDIGGYISSNWVGFLKFMANVAGVLATICGILAMIFAFIPGLEEFAALFETIALLAQFVAFACHVVLAATGHGSLFDIAVDAIGLVTFGIGKGLIGSAEAVATVSEEASAAYEAVAGSGNLPGLINSAGAAEEATAAGLARISIVSKAINGLKEVVSVRPVFKAALQAWKDGKFGEALGDNSMSTLLRGLRSAMGMGSHEIGEALDTAVRAASAMHFAQGTAWALTSRIQIFQSEFRLTQSVGIGTDFLSKLDQILHLGNLKLPGWDNVPTWPEHGG